MPSARSRAVLCFFAALAIMIGCCGCGVGADLTRFQHGLPGFSTDAGEWRDVDVVMRDGVKLHTRIMMPAGIAKAPIVLIRSPYSPRAFFEGPCNLLTRYGVGCVLQDVRGRLDSEGPWEPLTHERRDGHDTLAWLVKQPFMDGNIALFGTSYLAGTAWASAAPGPTDDEKGLPPEVKTLVVSMFGTDLQATIGSDGLFPHELNTAWAALMPDKEHPMTDGAGHWKTLLSQRPLFSADVQAVGHELPFYRAWLTGTSSRTAPVWSDPEVIAMTNAPTHVHVPVLFIDGYDDPLLTSALKTWDRLASKETSTLVLGPWNHVSTQTGDVKAAGTDDDDWHWGLALPWLLHALKGTPLPTNVAGLPGGTLAPGVWSAPRGDPERAKDLPFDALTSFPGATARASLWLATNTGTTDESHACTSLPLTSHAPAAGASATTTFTYDPQHPWPSQGGARTLAFILPGFGGTTPGPVTQTWPCVRKDVVRFLSAPRKTSAHMRGVQHLALRVRTSAPDTAFVAKLVDVDAGGRAVHITDGAVTLSHARADADAAGTSIATGDGSLDVGIDFWPTDWVLVPGHRLGLWVSSSSFPMFAVATNTAEPWYLATRPVTAEQTLTVGVDASRLDLSIAE